MRKTLRSESKQELFIEFIQCLEIMTTQVIMIMMRHLLESQPLKDVYNDEYTKQQSKFSGLLKHFNSNTGCPKVFSKIDHFPNLKTLKFQLTDDIQFGGYDGEVDYGSYNCNGQITW